MRCDYCERPVGASHAVNCPLNGYVTERTEKSLATTQEPRGWLTAEERSLVESLRATFQQNADGLRSAGSVGHAENWERRVRILDSLLARSSPPRVKVPPMPEQFTLVAWNICVAKWITAIRAAGGEVATNEVRNAD